MDAGGDCAGVAAEDGGGLVPDPGFGGGIGLVVEAPGGFPQVFEHVDEVDDDGDVDAACCRFGVDAVECAMSAERGPM